MKLGIRRGGDIEVVRNGNILVVDETPAVLEKARNVLAHAGFRPCCSDNPQRAQRLARRKSPILILLASRFDGLDVEELCADLAGDLQLAAVPVVIMNDPAMPLSRELMRELGITDSIEKPFAPEALLAVVEHALTKGRASPPQVTRPEGQEEPAPRPRDAAGRLGAVFARHFGQATEDPARVLLATLQDPAVRDDLLRLLKQAPRTALAGDLSAVPLAEVFQLLSMQRQSGVLSVWSDATQIKIAVEKGALRQIWGTHIPEELMLGNLVVREGLISRHEMRALLRSRQQGTFPLGAQLVALGCIQRHQLSQVLKIQSSELTYELLRWSRGKFHFERLPTLPAERMEFDLGLSVEALLMEGYRRVDEWGQIEATIRSFDAVFARRPNGESKLQRADLEPLDKEVLRAVNGTMSVRDLVNAVGASTFDVARALYRLVSWRVVVPV